MISIGNLQINKLYLGDVEVTKAYLGDVEVYGSTPQPVEKYLTMTVLDGDAGTTISPTVTGTLSPNLQYRVNNGAWNDFIVGTTADIQVAAGDVVQWKGMNTGGLSVDSSNYLKFAISGNPVSLSGNIMSLIDGVGDAIVVPCDYCFYKMFSKSNVKTVSQDFLPATTLTYSCYNDLFSESLLENSPELPATTLAQYCYQGMFYGCQNFTQAPALPATELASFCYQGLFQKCTSLVNPPEILPAQVLKDYCYYLMFSESAITTAPELQATVLVPYCYKNMFKSCRKLEHAPELNSTDLAQGCYDSMFYGCSALQTPPALPATVIKDSCYYQMFYGCTNLLSAPELPGENLENHCYECMFQNCRKLSQAPVLNCTTLVDNCYKEMFRGCQSLNYVKSMATEGTINSDGTAPLALQNWLNGVSSTGTFEKPAAAVYVTDSPGGIPVGWTVIEEKPKPEEKYLTMTVDESAGSTTISPTIKGSLPNLNLQYRINNGPWSDFIVGTTADIKVVAGDVVQWKGNNPNGVSVDYDNYLNFGISGNPVSLSGNIMSLIDGVGDTLVIPNRLCFHDLFSNSEIKTVSSDFLPATTLQSECYRRLFHNCHNLTTAPELPATTLTDYCYSEMFRFCESLTTAPELPAQVLLSNCYGFMFDGCSSLNYVKCLATEGTIGEGGTDPDALWSWLSGVSSTGTFEKPASAVYVTDSPSGIPQGWSVVNIDEPTQEKYMTMTVLDGDAGTTISPTINGTLSPNLQYRVNNGDWNDFICGTTADIHVVAGDVVNWKGVNESGLSTSYNDYLNFAISGNPVSLSGNLMSLIDGVGDALEIPCNYCFCRLFHGSSIKTVSQDFLPATTLADRCYSSMFSSCTSLVNAPALPATTLADSCYKGMFWDCTSLATAPVLPATILAYSCYRSMFEGCTALTTAPELSSTTLVVNCYAEMFYECTSLTTAPVLPATKLADNCYMSMFYNCTSLTKAPELPATTIAGSCYDMMFQGCSSLVDAPALPATTLADRCYAEMFYGCTSLTTAPELPATTLATWCYYSMFNGCTSLTTAPELPATTLADRCYPSMFYGCTSLTTAPELPATTLAYDCYASMFNGCTSLTTAPELPATTLTELCYCNMFLGCSKLNYVQCRATDITATDALKNWLSSVSSSGTFVKKYGVSYPTGISGIPKGWTVEEIDVPTPPEPEGKCMTITVGAGANGSTTIAPTVTGTISPNLQYRINNGNWNDFIVGTTADIQVVAGDFVQWKGNNTAGVSTSENDYLNFAISGNTVHLSGNVMSLIDGVGDALEIPNSYCFYSLFRNSVIKTVSSDFLPATTLTSDCYRYMFSGCTSLTAAPVLPATNIAVGCYQGMFQRCSNLIQAPALPATILKDSCYKYMFAECTSLVTAPELPATTLAVSCYEAMFDSSRKLNYVKSLAVEGLNSSNALGGWLYRVSSTGTFVKPAGVSYKTGASGIPSGWTISNI